MDTQMLQKILAGNIFSDTAKKFLKKQWKNLTPKKQQQLFSAFKKEEEKRLLKISIMQTVLKTNEKEIKTQIEKGEEKNAEKILQSL